MSAKCIACVLAGLATDVYESTRRRHYVAAVRIRETFKVNLMIGPPVDKSKDDFYVRRFLDEDGKKSFAANKFAHCVRYSAKKFAQVAISPTLTFPYRLHQRNRPYYQGVLISANCLRSARSISVLPTSPEVLPQKDGARN